MLVWLVVTYTLKKQICLIHPMSKHVIYFYLQLTPSPEIPTEKKEEIIDGALLKNLMNGQSNGEKPVKTDITHIPDNEFDELD